jgi:membrane protein
VLRKLRQLGRFAVRVLVRFQEDDGPRVAASLTYTTLLSLVPLATIALSAVSAFPVFAEFRAALQEFLAENMLPPDVAGTVSGHLDEFAANAARLTALGLAVLAVTAVLLMFTIERAFNGIWRVRHGRSPVARVLVYWGVLTLGPVLVGASLSMTSYLVGLSVAQVHVPGLRRALLGLIPLALTTLAFALLYYIVPNRRVQLRHALLGALVAAVMFELMKRGFALFVARFPSYQLVYGAFAAVPIFLVWIYLSWMVAVLGAVVTALLPDFGVAERARRGAGGEFGIALALLRALILAQRDGQRLGLRALAREASSGSDVTESVLERAAAAGWVARTGADSWVLACDADVVTLADVYRQFVFSAGEALPGARDDQVAALIDRTGTIADETLNSPIRVLSGARAS